MPQGSVTLTRGGAWQQVAPAGNVTVQKRSPGMVLIYVGAAAPANDIDAFVLTDEDPAIGGTFSAAMWAKAHPNYPADARVVVLS